jgi:ParB family chromosome partitioning protein
MGSSQLESLGATGRKDLFTFDPLDLTIVVDPKHPLHDERVHKPIPRWLVDSVKKVGVRDPVEVRQNGRDQKTGKPIVEVVDGRQRVRACRVANEELKAEGGKIVLVPAITARGDDKTLAMLMVIKNEHRQDDDLLTRAKKANRLIEMGWDKADVAGFFKVTKDTVDNMLKVLDLDEKVLAELNTSGKRGQGLPMNAGLILAELPRDKQVEAFEEMKAKGIVFGEAAIDFAREAVGKPAKVKPNGKGKANGKAVEEKETGPRMKTRAQVNTLYANIKDAGENESIPTTTRVIKWFLGEGELGKRWTGEDD